MAPAVCLSASAGAQHPTETDSVGAMADFEVRRDDLRTTRIVETDPPEPGDGEALLRVDRFGLTANNVTYGVMGDALSYWKFFEPSEEGWGRVPVWAYGEVVSANVDGIEPGERFYGFFPMSSYAVLEPHLGGPGFEDASAHRAELPPVYNRYMRVDPADEHADEQLILRPLFFTSYLIADFLRTSAWFGADAVVLGSASSKTAYGIAFLLASAEDGPRTIGLTSERNREFTESLDLYDRVVTYDEIAEGLSGDDALVYVDMSGDATVRKAVHQAAGDRLKHDAAVGATHWDQAAAADVSALPGPAPQFFFAPTHVERLTQEIGMPELQRRLAVAWDQLVPQLGGWMEIERLEGAAALERSWLALVDGEADPARAQVIGL